MAKPKVMVRALARNDAWGGVGNADYKSQHTP